MFLPAGSPYDRQVMMENVLRWVPRALRPRLGFHPSTPAPQYLSTPAPRRPSTSAPEYLSTAGPQHFITHQAPSALADCDGSRQQHVPCSPLRRA